MHAGPHRQAQNSERATCYKVTCLATAYSAVLTIISGREARINLLMSDTLWVWLNLATCNGMGASSIPLCSTSQVCPAIPIATSKLLSHTCPLPALHPPCESRLPGAAAKRLLGRPRSRPPTLLLLPPLLASLLLTNWMALRLTTSPRCGQCPGTPAPCTYKAVSSGGV